MSQVAALFVRSDSSYKSLPGVDAWDAERDARQFAGGMPVVAHPPCRAWGRLRQFAKPRADEKALGPWAVDQVRRWGGVLEHPWQSTLYDHCGLPRPGDAPDEWGGYAIEVDQFVFGHRARKPTWLYIVGCPLEQLPPIPQRRGQPTHCIRPTKHYPRLPSVTKAEREHTPEPLSRWLVEVARRAGFRLHVEDAPDVPPVLNHDPRATGDARRLGKRRDQLAVISREAVNAGQMELAV